MCQPRHFFPARKKKEKKKRKESPLSRTSGEINVAKSEVRHDEKERKTKSEREEARERERERGGRRDEGFPLVR